MSGVRRRCSQFEENLRLRSETGWTEFGYFEMVAPRALVFRPLVKENEDSGNEIVSGEFVGCKIGDMRSRLFLYPGCM